MRENLLNFIRKIKLDENLKFHDEASTKQGIILPILSYLGWNPFDVNEVYPEYSVSSKKVDYSLRNNNLNKVFIEVKKVNEDLEKHQSQLLNYAFQEGVKLAVLTNGITWWFYLPLNEGNWEQRKFYAIEILNQDEKEIVENFINFLSKENVISGKAIKNAENIYKSKKRIQLIQETLPKAWSKLLTEPDEILVELIAETTEKICGYKPDNKIVEDFLKNYVQNITGIKAKQKYENKNSEYMSIFNHKSLKNKEDYTGKSIVAFYFENKRYEVKSWRDMLVKICNIMFERHKENFDKVLNLKGKKREYFTKYPQLLIAPYRIKGTDIYIETHFNANSIVKLTKKIITIFGYKSEDIKIESK